MTPKPKVKWVHIHTSHLKDIRRVMSSVRSLSSLSKTRFTCCRGNTLRMQKVHKASLRSVCLFGLSIASPPPVSCAGVNVYMCIVHGTFKGSPCFAFSQRLHSSYNLRSLCSKLSRKEDNLESYQGTIVLYTPSFHVWCQVPARFYI